MIILVLTHEVVVPWTLGRCHEESQEPVREQHLDTFVVRGEVTLGVVACVSVLASPLTARGGQFVSGQGTWSRGETGTDSNSLNKRTSNLYTQWTINKRNPNLYIPLLPLQTCTLCYPLTCMWWWPFSPRPRMGCRPSLWRGLWCPVETAGATRLAECGSIPMAPSPVNITRLSMVSLNNIENDVNLLDMAANYDRRLTLRYSWLGRIFGRWTVWCVPHCGGNTIHLISFTWGLSGGLTPYK